MITFVGGSKFAKGGPNPLANMDSWGSISASGFGPGGPNPLGHRLSVFSCNFSSIVERAKQIERTNAERSYKSSFALVTYMYSASLQIIFVSMQVICLARDKF